MNIMQKMTTHKTLIAIQWSLFFIFVSIFVGSIAQCAALSTGSYCAHPQKLDFKYAHQYQGRHIITSPSLSRQQTAQIQRKQKRNIFQLFAEEREATYNYTSTKAYADDLENIDLSNNRNYNWTSKTFSIALPALAGMMTDPVLSMIDTLFVGKLGAVAASGYSLGSSSSIPLAALGACTSIFHLAFHCFRATTVATAQLVSGALVRDEQQINDGSDNDVTQKNTEEKFNRHICINKSDRSQREAVLISQTSIEQSLITGALLTSFLFVFGSKCLNAMGVSTENALLYESARTYLLHRSIAAPAVVMLSAAEGILRGYGDVVTPWKVSSIVALLNLVLDPFCMFGGGCVGGNGGMRNLIGLGMGIKGAAVATAASQIGGALLYGYFLAKRGLMGVNPLAKMKGILQRTKSQQSSSNCGGTENSCEDAINDSSQKSQQNYKHRKRKIAKTILRANASMVTKQGSLLLGWAYATSRATRMGPTTVAAHQLALCIWMLVALVLEGAGVAAQVLMSREWEELRLLGQSGKMEEVNDVASAGPFWRQRKTIHSLSKYMVNLSLCQGLVGTLFVLLLHKASPSFILTNDLGVRSQLLPLLPHLAAQMLLVSATLVTESLAIGGGRFKWLAGGTTISSVLAMLVLHGSKDLIGIWSSGIVTLFAGRLITASLAVLDMNDAFGFRKRAATQEVLI